MKDGAITKIEERSQVSDAQRILNELKAKEVSMPKRNIVKVPNGIAFVRDRQIWEGYKFEGVNIGSADMGRW